MAPPPASGLQVSRFSTASYRPKERVAAWREEFGRTVLGIDVAPRSPEDFHASATTYRSANLGLIEVSASAAHQSNSRALITSDDVSFGVVATSRWRASQLGRSVDLHPGDGVLMSNSDIGALTFPQACRYFAFSIPRALIEPLVPDIGALFGRRIVAKPALRLLAEYLKLAESGYVVSPELARTFTDHICDLLALALGAKRETAPSSAARGLRAARLHAIRNDIRRSVGRSDLSVHTVAPRHTISVRYLQKLFEESGSTFSEFVLEQRLASAYSALCSRAAVPISTIALEHGFNDLSYFNRAFRKMFGCTPSDVRRGAEMVRPDGDG